MNCALGAEFTSVPKLNTKVPITATSTIVRATSSMVPMIGETPFLLFSNILHTPQNLLDGDFGVIYFPLELFTVELGL
jgi:hypothetical protein